MPTVPCRTRGDVKSLLALAVANEPEDCYAEPYEEEDWPEDEDDDEELGTTQDFPGVLRGRPMDS